MKASLDILMDGLIDYAGLFPPASLDMRTAVRHYATARSSERARWLGRFVLPASRLKEFAQAHDDALGRRSSKEAPWPLAALVDNDLEASLRALINFNREGPLHGKIAVVDTLEMKVDTAAAIPRAMRKIPPGITTYFEIPIREDPSPFLVAIVQSGARAKVRTGGVQVALFPSTRDLARFLAAWAKAGIGFKATAGLHHPLRAMHRLTYAPDSGETLMHGFLNVFLAAAFAVTGMDLDGLTALLEEDSSGAFTFRDDATLWRGQPIAIERIREVRHNFAVACGSCSFEEPQKGLKEMGLL